MDQEGLLRWVASSIVGDFAAAPYDPACARATLEAAGRSADAHARFLQRWNGCYALGGALHVFGARPDPPNQSLDLWNRLDGWRQSFGLIAEGLWFFAENAFGDQFAYREGKVVRLKAAESRVEPVAASFAEWLEATLLDPQRWLALELFEACVARLGPLPPGGHFGPPPTHPAGAPLRAAVMEVLPARDNLELRAASAAVGTLARTGTGPFRAR